MLNESERNAIIAAYRDGVSVDMLQIGTEQGWGIIWTATPHSPDAMEKAARQFRRERAACIRHIRRARIRCGTDVIEAVIVTMLPGREQSVFDLTSTKRLTVPYLTDATLLALEDACLHYENAQQ